MNWKKFNSDVLIPFKEKNEDAAGMYMGDAQVFDFNHLRLIARKAFEAGVASQPNVEDGSAECRCAKCDFDYPVPSGCVCPYCGN